MKESLRRCKLSRKHWCARLHYCCYPNTCSVFNILKQTQLDFNQESGFKEVSKQMPIKFEGAGEDFSLPLLSKEGVGAKLEIKSVRFDEGQRYGEYAVMTLVDDRQIRTSNVVILKQLHRIKQIIKKEEDTVEVILKKVKRYYTF